jgi:hypothetical protein
MVVRGLLRAPEKKGATLTRGGQRYQVAPEKTSQKEAVARIPNVLGG